MSANTSAITDAMSRGKLKKNAASPLRAEIREIRTGLGLIQDEFAQRLGVVQSTVRNWESGRTTPNRRDLAKIRGLVISPTSQEPSKNRKGGASEETRVELHAALDIVLESGPPTVKEQVIEILTKFGGRPWHGR